MDLGYVIWFFAGKITWSTFFAEIWQYFVEKANIRLVSYGPTGEVLELAYNFSQRWAKEGAS